MKIVAIILMSLIPLQSQEKVNENTIDYICFGVEGKSAMAKGNIYIQSSSFLTLREGYNIENIKASFIAKIKKRWPKFKPRNEVIAHVCKTTKEVRLHLRNMNKHRHSLHTRRITFTKSNLKNNNTP